jgi:hypothetical protein
VHPEAYHSYLRGRYYWNKRTSEGFQKAIVEFDAAIATDPRFARAYAGLADSYYLIGFYSDIPFRDAMMKARTAAERALEHAYQARSNYIVSLKTVPSVDSLRDDPRFVELLQRAGLGS